MFEFPYNDEAKYYTLFIEFDTIQNSSSTFLIKKTEKMPLSLIGDLPLGKKYKWRVETKLKSGKTISSENHYFSILTTPFSDGEKYRITQHYNKKSKILDGLIWCDQFHCALNRDGKIVWFIPETHSDLKTQIRDFKFQKNGTLTFISKSEAYHTDINLNALWKAPNDKKISDTKIGDYHHDLEILSNGNYLVMANEIINFENDLKDDTVKSAPVDFTNLVEFNDKNEIVWSWLMKEHFPYEFLINSKIEKESGVVNPHGNSFCIDEKNNFIYLCFRDISRIIKIDKTTKKIVSSYGVKLTDEDDIIETDLFKLQHDVQLTTNNELLLFNNNDSRKGQVSSVEILSLPTEKNKNLEMKWDFKLKFDSVNNGMALKMGGIKTLTNKNYLICEGTLGRTVEINKNKEILWDLVIEKKDSLSKKYSMYPIYRVDFSKSLYPHYFSFALDKENNLLIFNKGGELDNYKIKIINTQNSSIVEKKIESIKPGTFKKISLNLNKSSKYTIEIISDASGIGKTIVF